ncbi:MAG: carboxypeptidase-like regulatory domain-containing protein, partial [Acidobacteriaceae bacterium]
MIDTNRLQRALLYLLPVFAIVLMAPNAARAQASRGSIAGGVHDPVGAVVPNATVTITNVDTSTSYPLATNSDGRFSYPALPPGNYKVTVAAPGFKEAVQEGITVSIGSTSTLDIGLQVGQTSQSVTVNADAQQIQTESSDVGTTVSGALIAQLPLNFSGVVRSPLQFMTLTPGFQGDSTGNAQSQASFKLNGAGTGQADVILDGSSIQLASPNYQWNFGISVDAVSEFKVQTSTFASEYGRTGGGFVNVASKSGTNEFHGAVYDLLKNAAFDANSWQNNHLGIGKANDTQNDFGGFGGGPIFIPKLYDGRGKSFWFFSYEGFRFKSGGPQVTSTATPQMWQGDFSQVLNAQTIDGVSYPAQKIYDYTTCSGVNLGKTCQAFPNNQIPLSRLDPYAKAFIPYLPVATSPGQAFQNLTYTL